MKILSVAGCRPDFIKIAPLLAEMKKHPELSPLLVHTGQHYDEAMSAVFFRDLELPMPDVCLNVGSGSHARQMALITERFEQVLLDARPDLVFVVGDVNSTVACSLTAVHLGIPVAHVDAGLRSFDRQMAEEVNRVVTDTIADFLFATERSGVRNLLREGISAEKIFLVGNVMIDSLLTSSDRIARSTVLSRLQLRSKRYALVTLHRASNVDDRRTLERIVNAWEELQSHVRLVLPLHSRTRARLEQFGIWPRLMTLANLQILDAVGYLDCLKLMRESLFVMTDSGGVQEESTALGIPCLTVRDNTERPVTVTHGTNRLVGTDPDRLVGEAMKIIHGHIVRGRIPPKWDGRASQRIVATLLENRDRIRHLYHGVRDRAAGLDVVRTAFAVPWRVGAVP